ncbi:MAG TPA: hypothetical protein PLN56_06595 [Methanoregulaceae archaeon]|nr:hypothetical protein [Methanoregulaceae archaeon]HPD10647.1 hypothetical protein [Methanoregulaceae archaeon]HRT15778.1 hypothetical protein [Methanoregulaceae archaeon]HRU31292.1 hypothetical protein [Methanoregulaceae archaeon]
MATENVKDITKYKMGWRIKGVYSAVKRTFGESVSPFSREGMIA